MERIETMTIRELYRGILKFSLVYPSLNRKQFRQAIIEEVQDWKTLKDELEISKANKKLRMLYAHTYMYKCKVDEINSNKNTIDEPFDHQSLNRRKDKDWIFF